MPAAESKPSLSGSPESIPKDVFRLPEYPVLCVGRKFKTTPAGMYILIDAKFYLLKVIKRIFDFSAFLLKKPNFFMTIDNIENCKYNHRKYKILSGSV